MAAEMCMSTAFRKRTAEITEWALLIRSLIVHWYEYPQMLSSEELPDMTRGHFQFALVTSGRCSEAQEGCTKVGTVTLQPCPLPTDLIIRGILYPWGVLEQ